MIAWLRSVTSELVIELSEGACVVDPVSGRVCEHEKPRYAAE